MGANSTQAVAITIFLIAFVALAGAFAGGGVMIAVAALVLLGISCFFFLKAKPWEQQQESTERKIDGNHLTAKEAGR
jgi:Na+/H+-translocating membrane pyrophosphatase